MKQKFNTDLACENAKFCGDNKNYEEINLEYCTVLRQSITDERCGKEADCVTVFCDKLNLLDEYTQTLISLTLSEELVNLIGKIFNGKKVNELSYLIVGLGNSDFTADSIGPSTAQMIIPTKHILPADRCGMPSVSVFIPGVVSKSGIESANMVKSVSNEILPDLVIAIDSLSARSCERLGKTIQISSSGISPGSGVRNSRIAINEETVGIPVISVGVPTVVDSATLVLDTLERAGFEKIDENLFAVLKESKSFFVTPKECDDIVKSAAELISKAIHKALGIIS